MRVKSVTSHILRAPLGAQKFYSSQAPFPERNSCLVRVETDTGLVGWGEGGQYGPPEPVAACVDAVFAPRLIGRNPTEPVRIWEEHYACSRDFGQKGNLYRSNLRHRHRSLGHCGPGRGPPRLEAAWRTLPRLRHRTRDRLLLPGRFPRHASRVTRARKGGLRLR
jgi:hypothetical protein